VRYRPADIADLGFLYDIAGTDGALVGAEITPEQRARLGAQGAWESAQSYTLAGSPQGSYFETIDLSGRDGQGKMELLLTADVGPGLVAPPEDAWKPSMTVSLPDNMVAVDIAQAFSNGWGFPGDRDRRESGSTVVNLAREAGYPGYLIALPWLVAEAPRLQLRRAEHGLADRPKGSLAFARTGFFSQAESLTFFGVLPDSTPRAAAECVLVAKAPCSGPQKLELDRVTSLSNHRFARLVQVDSRFVVYLSLDRSALPAKATLRELGPARAEVALKALVKQEQLDVSGVNLPDRLIAGVERTPRAIVFRLAVP
jgi:hypothetical protein